MSLDQIELAAKLGKSQSYISKVENGDVKIDLHTLTVMAKILKKPVEYFVNQ
ncbi:MAG: helix-turn-helix transcriptional regulator [Chitinophagales bacterium]|nr:helix-turn-helix transcriptional regulator [Chitinophagales bacterium]